MRNIILIFLFPLFAISQSNSQSAGGFRFYDTNKSNITLYQTTGSRFYHEKFLTSIIKGKKVAVRFDAFKDAMYIRFNDNYFEYLMGFCKYFCIFYRFDTFVEVKGFCFFCKSCGFWQFVVLKSFSG